MKATMERRGFLAGTVTAAATLALPARAFAQASPLDRYQRKVMEVAARETQRNHDALWRTDIAGIADFARHSREPRFHIANLEAGTLRSFLVTHGRGSDPEHCGLLHQFSNEPGSYCTSRGAYITYDWYKGKYGTSVRLGGLEADNSNVLSRAVVIHPADYAEPHMIDRWGKLGRSDGCFALGRADFHEALWTLSGGRLLYADRIESA
jgi:hypothetical protein